MKNWQKIKQNSELMSRFLVREKVIDGIREFFKKDGFNEVETPQMVRYPGTEPFLDVFETTLKWAGGKTERVFMSTSPEFAMKKLLVAGFQKIFQVCKSFRNGEGLSPRHNPEFTILEWYRAEADYEDIMRDCEGLLLFLVQNLCILKNSAPYLTYQNKKYNLSTPWPRLSVAEAFERWVGLSVDELLDRDAVVRRAKKEGYSVDENTTWEEAYNQLFLNLIEPEIAKFTTPVIIYDYPASQAAYSKKKKSDLRFAERFEFYLAGLELGNAFSEENDPRIQKAKFEEDLELRKKLGKTDYGMDRDYIDALESGLPNSGGIAVGVDRLIMLFSGADSIQETMFFPMKKN